MPSRRSSRSTKVPDAQRAGHERVRAAHALETAEDYAEAIADLVDAGLPARVVDLARRFGVSHVTVSRTVSRLVKAGLVRTSPYQPITLTAKGRRLAHQARARHEVVLRFLLALGVSERTARSDAEGIEHHVSPQTLRAFQQFLARQSRDGDGG